MKQNAEEVQTPQRMPQGAGQLMPKRRERMTPNNRFSVWDRLEQTHKIQIFVF